MLLTDGNDTNPPTYKPGGDNSSDGNDVDSDDDIVLTPGSKTEEQILSLPPYNWRACRFNLAKDITKPATKGEKMAWDQELMPARKQFDNF